MNKIEQFAEFLRSKPKPNGEKYSEKYVMEVCGLAKRLPNPITVGNVNQFLKERQWHPPACRAVSTFMQWYLYGDIGKEILEKMKKKYGRIYVSPKKPRDYHTKILSFEEVRKLYENAPDLKTKLIIMLLYDTAVRRGDSERELLGIQLEDIYFGEKKILVTGKGGRKEPVYFTNKTMLELQQYLKENKIKKGSIFPDLTPYKLYYLIRKLGGKVLGKNISPHWLRYTSLTHSADEGADAIDIQQKGRHKDIKTSMIYVEISKKRRKEAFLEHHKEI